MPAIRRGEVIPENIRRCMPGHVRQELGAAAATVSDIEEKNGRKLEAAIQDQIEQELRRREIPFNRSRMDKRTTCKVGWPDFSFVIHGFACFLEVKRPGETPTPKQAETIEALTKAGARVCIVQSLAAAIEKIQLWSQSPSQT